MEEQSLMIFYLNKRILNVILKLQQFYFVSNFFHVLVFLRVANEDPSLTNLDQPFLVIYFLLCISVRKI